MNRHRMLLLCLTVSVLATTSAFAEPPDSGAWPMRWQVNANGVEGVLEFSIRDDGSLTGHLLGADVAGYVAGRHLFVRRTDGDRAEFWEGWLGEGTKLIVAGTISVDQAGQTLTYPWFGIPEEASASTSQTPSTSASPPAAVVPPPAPVPPPATPPPSDDPLSGAWATADGERIEILQTGNALSVTRSDGSSHSGRMTGSSTFVVGLGKGCCSGKLDGPNVIEWSDGVRWRRTN